MIAASLESSLAAGQPEAGARRHLRAATAKAHAAIEATATMLALMGPRPTVAAVAAVIEAQRRILEPAEEALAAAPPAARRFFAGYRPRAPIAREDLLALGANPDDGSAPNRRWIAALSSPEAWLGFRYVVEGSTLGGVLIARRLAETAAGLPPLSFFNPDDAARGSSWRAFCDLLEAALPDRATRDRAAGGANAAFDVLRDALEGIAR